MSLSSELSLLQRTPNSAANPAIYYRAWRDHNMGKARLCATVAGRQTWVDLAREQHAKMLAAMRAAREHSESLRFGNYRQRQVSPGVWKLELLDERAVGAL